MKLMPDCNDCCICAAGGRGCLAGIGDNDFSPAKKEEIIRRLDNNLFSWNRDRMIEFLKTEYGYDYE